MFVETEARPAGEPAKVGALKLSEAIRIGARIRPQCADIYFEDGKSCALGAAWEGLGNKYDERRARIAQEVQEALKVPIAIIGSVVGMNDGGDSREQIADWLESQGF